MKHKLERYLSKPGENQTLSGPEEQETLSQSAYLKLPEEAQPFGDVPNEPESDDNLVQAALADPLAFLELYNRWVSPVYRYFLSHLQDQACAEDLTANLFVKLWKVLPSYRQKGRFSGWMFRIARNLLMDHYRHQAREERYLKTMMYTQIPANHQEPASLRMAQLRGILQQLKQEELELLRLRYGLEMDFGQIATALNKSSQAVKKQLYRLQERMRREMEAQDENPETE